MLLGALEQAGLGNYTALRAVRVLRPLRTVTRIRGLRVGGARAGGRAARGGPAQLAPAAQRARAACGVAKQAVRGEGAPPAPAPPSPPAQAPVVALLRSLPQLADVLVLCAFAFFLFGVVAVQLFAGALRNRRAAPRASERASPHPCS